MITYLFWHLKKSRFLTDIIMSREFTAAVEQKQVAQQDAEKARFLVEKAEFVKKAAVIQVPALISYSRTLALTFLMSG